MSLSQTSERISVEEGFLSQVDTIRRRSPDFIKCGAIITDLDNRVMSQGYNGYPRKVDNTKVPDLREFKLHAEVNALANLRDIPRNIGGGICYISREPCFNCLLLLWQFGVEVVRHLDFPSWQNNERNIYERTLKRQLLELTTLKVYSYDGNFVSKENNFDN